MQPHAPASEAVRLPGLTLHPEDNLADALVWVQLVELFDASSTPGADRRDPGSQVGLSGCGACLSGALAFVIKEDVVIAERGACLSWRRSSLLLDEARARR